MSVPVVAASNASEFDRFVPRPSTNTTLDFAIWDRILKETVLFGGPSLRKKADKPTPTIGTRIVFGHTSPYRLEGNRVVFEGIRPAYVETLNAYLEDLVRIGNQQDIAALPKNEQLAYWLNLHNAIVITKIAEEYRISNPSRIEGPDGLRFHDSKWITIDGVPLSLKNIREDIVFRNWSDPIVMYGFFHGDIGSPSIQRAAFTSETLRDTLNYAADEFVNSLRGFQRKRGRPFVSRHYQDVAPYFFPDFDADLRSHLKTYMNADVRAELSSTPGAFEIEKYELVVADMTGGDGIRYPGRSVTVQTRNGLAIGSTLDRAIEEQREKFIEIRNRGLSGTVVIEDIETVDPDAVDIIE
ncbi:MAG: DUF547 domain-containing protein [Litorimonas sp.]